MDYRVQRGDTLSALAKQHGTTVDAIMDANRGTIVDKDRIYTGETITIPGPAKAAKVAASDVQPTTRRPAPAPRADVDAGVAELEAAPMLPATPPAPTFHEPPTTQVVYEQYASPVAPQPATTQVMGARSDDVEVVHVQVPTSQEDHAYEQQVVDLVNQIRAQHGLPALAYDARLDRGAEAHTAHQATVRQMAHDGIGDGTPQERMLAAGWNWAWGENAAVGQTTPEQVVREWMASPGHRANILNPDFAFLSVGFNTAADGRPYWTQSFGAGA